MFKRNSTHLEVYLEWVVACWRLVVKCVPLVQDPQLCRASIIRILN